MKKTIRRVVQYIPLIAFSVFMLGYALLNVLTPSREYSEMENRPLAQVPKPTVSTVVSNEFSNRFETYISDQFLLRNGWITTKSALEAGLGKIENNAIVYGADDYMFEKTLTYDDEQFSRNLGFLENFLALDSTKDSKVYFSLVPSSSHILADKVPRGLPLADEKAYIQTAYDRLGTAGFEILSLEETMTAHKDEYIYYRTDHHWTTTGAYYAYRTFAETLGLSPVSLGDFPANKVEDFYGTYYSKAKKVGTVPDEITWYDIPVDSVEIGTDQFDGLYDIPQFEQRDKYAAFLHSNHGVTVIKNSSSGETNSRIVVFKDSYGNSFVPYLTAHFDEIVVIDTRYVGNLKAVLEEYPTDMYYLLYSIKNFTEDDTIVKLSGLL